MDTKTFDDMVVTRNTQASKSSELPTFGVDISRDILRAVTGEPSDASFAKRLSGADALVMNVDIEPVDLPKLCDQLLQAFGEEKYKADFEWIDHLSLITDSAAKEQLNDLLVQQLQVGDDSSTHLAMPEAIGWEDIDAFKIAGAQPTEYEDLDLSLYLGRLGAGSHKITLGKLRSRRVSVRFTRTGEYDSRWTLYQCLISEQRLGSKLHVLIEGRWFTVSDSLVGEVDLFANGLAPSATALIPALHGEPEAVYNARLAQSQPEELLLLDARIKRPGGASSGIELCDLLTSSGEFIHVKRKSRSSTLSHLFAQGTVSARTFVGDGHFRDEMRKAIESGAPGASSTKWLDLVPSGDQRVSGSDYSVAYVVISDTRRQGIDWLPFFSKLNLMQHGKQLQSLGFSVSISRVDISK